MAVVMAAVVLIASSSLGSGSSSDDPVIFSRRSGVAEAVDAISAPEDSTASTPALLSSWAYAGCGPFPTRRCPWGAFDVTPAEWSVDDYLIRDRDGHERPWQTMIFEGGGNMTKSAALHAAIHLRTGVSLPVMWEWNAWRSEQPVCWEASLRNFSNLYRSLVRQYPRLPDGPFGIFLGDEPHFELVSTRLADAAAAVKRQFPHATTYVNLEWVTITNASVPPILGAATALDWVGADLYYDDPDIKVNASVPAMRAVYNEVVYPHLRPEQRIVLIPWAHYCAFYCPIGPLPLEQGDAFTLSVARAYRDWADTDKRVAAVLIYHLKMVWRPANTDACENPPYIVGKGNLSRVPWNNTSAGNGVGLVDRCAQDALLRPIQCPRVISGSATHGAMHTSLATAPPPLGPLADLRAQWMFHRGQSLVLAASPVGAPLCLTHLIPHAPCQRPMHRTYDNVTHAPTCDDYLGVPPQSAGLLVASCNSTAAVWERQRWSCLDATNCRGASRIEAMGHPGCERLPGFDPPPAAVPQLHAMVPQLHAMVPQLHAMVPQLRAV
jgi:hypothetical protein